MNGFFLGASNGQLICHLNPTCLCQLVRREARKCGPMAFFRVKGWVVSIPSCGASTARYKAHLKRIQCAKSLMNKLQAFYSFIRAVRVCRQFIVQSVLSVML